MLLTHIQLFYCSINNSNAVAVLAACLVGQEVFVFDILWHLQMNRVEMIIAHNQRLHCSSNINSVFLLTAYQFCAYWDG
jgi:hypothetical protein